MAKKPPTEPQYASDLSGEDIPVGDLAIIRITLEGDDYVYVLDASREEVGEMMGVAVKQKKAGRPAKTNNDGGNPTAETTEEGSDTDDDDTDEEGETDAPEETTSETKPKGRNRK